MSSSNLKVVSLSVLTTFLLTFSGCGSSGCCPDLKKSEDSVPNLETLAVTSPEQTVEVEPTEEVTNDTTSEVVVNTPPISIINGITSTQGILGSTLLVDGSSSSDDSEITSYKWSVNGEVVSTDEKTDIILEQPGTYTICLDVTDANNETHQTCKEVIVPEPSATNTPPVSVINGVPTTEGILGSTLLVDGSSSSDDVNITSYQWSVNGLVVSTEETTEIILNQAGTYNICLDVTDTGGATDQTCEQVIVPEAETTLSNPPVANITGIIDNEQKSPGTVTVDGMTSSDDVGVVSYQWSIDDVNTSTEPTTTVDLNIPSSKICLTVTDEDNQTNQTCKNITVVTPTLPKAVVSGLDGVVVKTQCPIIVSANGSSSENSTISNYQWLLDGTEVATTQDINISIATEGIHKLCLNVTDSIGATSEENCQDINVQPHVNPTAVLTLLDAANQPVTNKILLPNQTYSLSCAGSIDDCDREVSSCEWNASSYLVDISAGTKIPYIKDCFNSDEHTGHGDKITTTAQPSNITLCGSTDKFNVVEVTLTVTDVLGNSETVIETYTVNP